MQKKENVKKEMAMKDLSLMLRKMANKRRTTMEGTMRSTKKKQTTKVAEEDIDVFFVRYGET